MIIASVLASKGSNVFKLRTSSTVIAAAQKLAEHRIGAMIVEDDKMHDVGIFSERDLVNALGRHGAGALAFEVHRLMSSPIISCKSTDDIDDVMGRMTLSRIRHMPVIDGDTLVGIVSIGDLVKRRLDEKELEANVLLDISRMRG